MPLLLAALVLASTTLAAPGPLLAAGLQVHDLALRGEVVRVEIIPEDASTAQGSKRAGLVAVARRSPTGTQGALTLHAIRVEAGVPAVTARWETPPGTVYAEPVQLPGKPVAWLALGKDGWRLGRQHPQDPGAPLRWNSLCDCPLAALPHGPGSDDQRRFARDLDGRPGDEIVLPYPGHAAAFRLHTAPLGLEPLWRAHWNPNRAPLDRAGRAHVLPMFYLERLAPAGHIPGSGEEPVSTPIGLIRFMGDHLLVNRVAGTPAGAIEVTREGREALLDLATNQDWPDSLQGALAVLTPGTYPDAGTLLQRLADGEPDGDAWSAHIPAILEILRPLPVPSPMARVSFGGLDATDADEDRDRLIAMADMDGDGILDLLHARLMNYGSVLKQKNQLRWYRGQWRNGGFGFAPPAGLMESDAGSFADLVLQRRDGEPPLALLLATTEVSFSSIMKALASGKVPLDVRIMAFRTGGLQGAPLATGRFTYHDLRTEGRRAMFLLADLNGDGLRDYLANFKEGELSYFPATKGTTRLAGPTFTQPGLPLPSHPSLVTIGDLDGDGREEMVLRYREKYHGPLSHTLRIVRYRP